jgi:hypothetical protein
MSEVENAENSANQVAQAPIVIKVSEVLTDLQSGMTREQIRVKLGLTKGQLVEVFKNPKLKGKKTKVVASGFIIEDDTETPEVTQEEVAPAPAQRTTRASRASVSEVGTAPVTSIEEESIATEPVVETPPVTEEAETPEVEEIKEEDEKSPWDR